MNGEDMFAVSTVDQLWELPHREWMLAKNWGQKYNVSLSDASLGESKQQQQKQKSKKSFTSSTCRSIWDSTCNHASESTVATPF